MIPDGSLDTTRYFGSQEETKIPKPIISMNMRSTATESLRKNRRHVCVLRRARKYFSYVHRTFFAQLLFLGIIRNHNIICFRTKIAGCLFSRLPVSLAHSTDPSQMLLCLQHVTCFSSVPTQCNAMHSLILFGTCERYFHRRLKGEWIAAQRRV